MWCAAGQENLALSPAVVIINHLDRKIQREQILLVRTLTFGDGLISVRTNLKKES